MNELVRAYFSDYYIRWILVLSLALNIGLFAFFLFFVKQSSIPIVLHYNVDWGVDYFGEVKNIFILPVIGLIIFLFNGVLSLRFWLRHGELSYYLASVTLTVEFFLWLSGIALYIINS
ncbi:hypothetical protein A2567_00450 [Candidatus Azambacteria bacterium RIFOXYD1_FULL_42_11]|uniref:DUF1648 domain-containing protein n=4 Tax=Candidatus Azamiibacteriota TaxID=1752741 RepID=A0A0G1BII8_9BACT|nr:MAG: hypothetical protein UV07_C0011G0006 [Candidatus Azambacteria bacterium GW2011_GWB1_42_17]KKS46096.1 MAG: hypothetical protein UV10_C0008G0006 [Candidatus Azambacteria bacterium GW2011_GWA1_42_19]KKS75336.1 MAG: hypothetical protein UV48_C0014G0019 [Candidatus Azambacteria bacterium GW2011_GWA2_42_9]KKS88275.1 MAG: hypothetical protein UV62_C0010G0004 [Parcubacteria group bacterium GW2011_GWC1_43_11]OGD41927.1 MAG: hypothetical protein A2567_00450 [Candidatus Azambacteria bacterium RIFO